eukprot:Skav220493  [mRNA]  locus=scaffold1191:7248:12222:- [translate_table: standard]
MSETFLDPSKQLLQDQGTTVFKQIFDLQGKNVDKAAHFGATLPKSVAEYLLEHESSRASTDERQKQAEQELNRSLEKRDSFDDLWSEEEAEGQTMPNQPRRPAGIRQSTLTMGGSSVASGRLSQRSTTNRSATPSAPASSAAAQPTPRKMLALAGLNAGDESNAPSASKGKASADQLDPEMKMVAEKHLQTDHGSGVKALIGLEPSTFLDNLRNRVALPTMQFSSF